MWRRLFSWWPLGRRPELTYEGVADEVAPTVPGLEFTLPTNRMHFTLSTNRMHSTLGINRLHFEIPPIDFVVTTPGALGWSELSLDEWEGMSAEDWEQMSTTEG